MEKTSPAKSEVDSYTIPGTNKVVRGGDCVLISKNKEKDAFFYVARIEKFKGQKDVKVKVRWYYRPEESIGGRRNFHGRNELFLTNHFDKVIPESIKEKCTVHTFDQYRKLENLTDEDYYSRFEYDLVNGTFTPDIVSVYCLCEMPYNPDKFMLKCEGCKDRYHPACVGLSIDKAKKLERYMCSTCSSGK